MSRVREGCAGRAGSLVSGPLLPSPKNVQWGCTSAQHNGWLTILNMLGDRFLRSSNQMRSHEFHSKQMLIWIFFSQSSGNHLLQLSKNTVHTLPTYLPSSQSYHSWRRLKAGAVNEGECLYIDPRTVICCDCDCPQGQLSLSCCERFISTFSNEQMKACAKNTSPEVHKTSL